MTSAPKYTLRWSAQAERNVEEVASRVARRDPDVANEWIERVIDHVESTTTIPLAGRIVPELNRLELRETFLGRYRIVYRIDGATVTLVTVFAGARHGWPDELDPDAD
jgi:plasmid stabilization system protein ParE